MPTWAVIITSVILSLVASSFLRGSDQTALLAKEFIENRFGYELIAACNRAAEQDDQKVKFGKDDLHTVLLKKMPSKDYLIAELEVVHDSYICNWDGASRARVGSDIKWPSEEPDQ